MISDSIIYNFISPPICNATLGYSVVRNNIRILTLGGISLPEKKFLSAMGLLGSQLALCNPVW